MDLEALVMLGAGRAVPDSWKLTSLDRAVARRARTLAPSGSAAAHFTEWMNTQADAPATAANEILPPAFYEAFLGPQMSLNSAFYMAGCKDLMQAEQAALRNACTQAGLADGQEILDLGCGWGAMTLLAAETFPRAHLTAFTTSPRQAAYVQAQAQARGLHNVTVECGDVATFIPAALFDRVMCMDMMARTANWRGLLTHVREWLKADGRFFAQMPTHITTPHCVDAASPDSAAPGIVASQGLIRQFNDLFAVESEQHLSGTHASRTALQWLENFDRNHQKIGKLLRAAYGRKAEAKRHAWRAFFLEASRKYGHAFGDVWGVGQYTLTPQPEQGSRIAAHAGFKAAFATH